MAHRKSLSLAVLSPGGRVEGGLSVKPTAIVQLEVPDSVLKTDFHFDIEPLNEKIWQAKLSNKNSHKNIP